MLRVSNISVMYGAHRALEDAAVRVDSGEIVVILGANGAGKSSLLKAIAGTCEGKVTGKVELDGISLSGLPAEIIVVRGIAFVPEGRGIFGDLTVSENLMLGAHAPEARERQDTNLARVYELFPKLKERAGQAARTMSGGEQQMVAIGRAIMANPKILMLDEPSLGLSPLLCKELFQNLSHICDTGIGVLMVEQNAKQSLAISDRAYLLENGTIINENTAQAMMNDPAVQAAYLGGAQGSAVPINASVNTQITTPAMDRDAPVGDGDAAFASARKYIQPFTDSHQSGTRTQVAGIDIGSLVDKASAIASSAPLVALGLSTPDVKSVSVGTVPPISSNDPDVKSLLVDFENAARGAFGPTNIGSGADAISHKQEPIDDDKNLPAIPVYRRSGIEVYRRTPDGDLTRVKER